MNSCTGLNSCYETYSESEHEHDYRSVSETLKYFISSVNSDFLLLNKRLIYYKAKFHSD